MDNWLLASVRARQEELIATYAQRDPSDDLYGGVALMHLAANADSVAANEKLRDLAQWFTKPHPNGRDPFGECDFAAIKLTWAYHRFARSGRLEPATMDAIKTFFLTYDFQSKYTSENHQILFHTARYLMASVYPTEVFGRYGLTGQTLQDAERIYLRAFITFRARQGWDEFDSGCYFTPVWEALCALNDFAPDESIRRLANMMLNVRLADMAVDTLDGMYCGAHGRIYERHALDHKYESTFFLQYLYLGGEQFEPDTWIPEAILSTFCPEPIVKRIFSERPHAYETRERVHAHCSTYLAPERPLPQEDVSLRKMTYMTPRYALGCVQGQDAYAPGSLAAWHTGHQQHECDLTFAGAQTDCRIFTHHPGHGGAEGAEHGYWTGDMLCNCGCHFQHQRAVLALHSIPQEQEYGFIHAHLPRARFDEVRMLGSSVYVRQEQTYAMLRFVHPYRWVEEGPYAGREIISDGRKNGAVIEVCDAEEFDSFEGFIAQMECNTLELDENNMKLTYRSILNGTLTLSRGERTINGEVQAFDYPAFDSPYLYAAWDSGVITLKWGDEQLTYDFINIAMS